MNRRRKVDASDVPAEFILSARISVVVFSIVEVSSRSLLILQARAACTPASSEDYAYGSR